MAETHPRGSVVRLKRAQAGQLARWTINAVKRLIMDIVQPFARARTEPFHRLRRCPTTQELVKDTFEGRICCTPQPSGNLRTVEKNATRIVKPPARTLELGAAKPNGTGLHIPTIEILNEEHCTPLVRCSPAGWSAR